MTVKPTTAAAPNPGRAGPAARKPVGYPEPAGLGDLRGVSALADGLGSGICPRRVRDAGRASPAPGRRCPAASRASRMPGAFAAALSVLALLAAFAGILPPPARAQVEAPAMPGGFAAEGRLAGLIWEISGYLTEDTRTGENGGWRARRVAPLDGGPRATLAMRFGWIDPWPLELRICADDGERGTPGHGPLAAGDGPGEPGDGGDGAFPGGPGCIGDRKPFGGENLTGIGGASGLEETLERYVRGLRGGPRVLAGPWEGIGRGMAFSESRALYGVRFGSPEVLVVKADPEVWELAPYFSGEGGGDPARQARSVREWAEEIPGAALVVNGGQYYADGTSMGKLSRGGAEIESRRHPGWKGFLSSGPAEGRKARPFAVADEELPRTGEEPGAWLNVLQSYMALDRLGRVRVKSSASLASRTAVGEDADGRICIVYVPGAATLYDLALILGDLEIFPAVSLDGGFESQMALRRGGGWLFYQGEYSHNALGNVFVRLYQPKLRLAAALVPAGGPGPAEPRAARMPGAEALPGEAPVLRGAPRAEDARKPEGPEPEREREPERDGAARTGR